MSNFAKIVAVLSCVSCFIFGYKCNKKNAVITTTETKYIKGDSVPYFVSVPTAKLCSISYFVFDTAIQIVDTAAILKNYFATFFYADTLLNDSSAFIFLKESITKNTPTRELFFANKRATSIIYSNTFGEEKKAKHAFDFSAGVVAGNNLAAPFLQVRQNKMSVIGGYNFSDKSIIVGAAYHF